ncbi:phage holin family protein [Gleimia sp. 6138-11-ORH1]|uniref:phage holin family protein n=1 Tax=Gleimia sp. 6138-11-ORH1 TaxID=2973937 RepID=UPI002166F70E|nr:phage holin family protein [Gleimia sp. 6138-11-ORH1]MCS4484488.1 phage holin family protein [Gleimia sp. 6138-11-ORH1]
MHDLHIYSHAFKGATALAGGVVGWFFGQADGFLLTLIAFTIADYISGVLAAIATRQLSSAVGFKGIAKKILILTLVGLAYLLDAYLLHGSDALRMAVIFFYISNEGISLIENAARLGLPVPPQVREVLKTLTTGSPPIPQNPPSSQARSPPSSGSRVTPPYQRRH